MSNHLSQASLLRTRWNSDYKEILLNFYYSLWAAALWLEELLPSMKELFIYKTIKLVIIAYLMAVRTKT